MVRTERQVLRKLARSSVKVGLAAKNSLYEIFHENTKLGPLTSRAYFAWIYNFGRSHRTQQATEQAYKVYTLMERRDLPAVQPHTELERTIAARRSVRKFSGAPLSLDELSRLLYFTYGRTDPRGQFRAVASGGALYPLELYVAVFKVEGLEPGLYHYAVENGGLDVVEPGDAFSGMKSALSWESIDIDNASVAIIMTAAFRRNTVKYLDRGYRLILMEAGEAAQNLCLLATSMNLGACLLGGFNDDQLSALLGIDGVDEAPLLPVLLGRAVPASAS